jgi:Mur ligase family, catalytic domain
MTAFPYRKAHFIGLAGVGMSATAILMRDSGVAVTGSDEAIYPPISQVLAREAFACRAPYAAQNIPDDADLIVIGKNARLVPNEMRRRGLLHAQRGPAGQKFCPSPKCSRFFRVGTRTLWWPDLSARRQAFR